MGVVLSRDDFAQTLDAAEPEKRKTRRKESGQRRLFVTGRERSDGGQERPLGLRENLRESGEFRFRWAAEILEPQKGKYLC